MPVSLIAPVLLVAAASPAAPQMPRAADVLAETRRVADWQLAHLDSVDHMPAAQQSVRNPRDWQQATFWVAITELADRDPRYAKPILALGARENWRLGDKPFHADDQLIGQAWIWSARHGAGKAALAPAKAYFDAVLAHRPTGSLKFVPRDRGDPVCTDRWCWCDALFMAPPTLWKLAASTGDNRYSDFADEEFRATKNYLYDRSEHLFFRDSRFFDRRDDKGRKLFWSRGNGWVMAGLVRILETMSRNDPRHERYEHLFREMAARLVTLQKPDGYWAPSLLDTDGDTPPESSGTAFFTYAFAWGVRTGLLDEKIYKPAAIRGWGALNRAVQPDGMLGWVQQVSDRPDSVSASDTQFYGAGAFILAGSAMYDLARKSSDSGLSSIGMTGPESVSRGAPDYATSPHGRAYVEQVAPMNQTVADRLMPQVDTLLSKLLRERRDMTLDDVRVFESDDKFLPGKIAVTMAYRITELPKGDPRLEQRLSEFNKIAELTVNDENHSWGIYYYMSALHRLKQAGLLERAVRPATLAKLRKQLDWRRFVRPDLTLIDLPNNYYGVAFSIARLRYLLGWEDEKASEALLDRMLDHYRRYSGKYGFADETQGKGRFDRYSVLLIGEIVQRLVETGMSPSPEVKGWLRRSVDLMLPRFNLTGEGFEYGRSIGAYGETAFLEVLTAAARVGVLTPTEQRMAYAFSSRIAARYMDFWVDPATGSVNLWDHGRRTDAYRGKHRIFGENLSLARQFLYTNAIWNDLGFKNQAPDPRYARWLQTLPKLTTTWFARGEYDRAVVTVRDGGRAIGLPIINGAEGQHMHNPYFPIPFSAGMLQGSADSAFPQLVPQIKLADGSTLMPLAFFEDVQVSSSKDGVDVSWHQDALDKMGENDAQPDRRIRVETHYRFLSGRIERTDRIIPASGVRIANVTTQFATYSGSPTASDLGTTAFDVGEVTQFATKGYGSCAATDANHNEFRSPTGPFATVVSCQHVIDNQREPLTVSWLISYDPFRN